MTPTQQQTPSFCEYLREKVGRNWVIARRTTRIVERYGPDVVCLTSRRYADLERQFEIETYGAPLKSIQDASPDLLAALRSIAGMRRDTNTDDAQLSALYIAIAKTACAKAEGR